MTETHSETVGSTHQRRFNWFAFLPKRRAWIQTLVLLPFALPIANFLGSSYNIAVNLITQENNYILGVLTMLFSLIIPFVFFSFCLHWIWFLWKQESPSWYPRSQGLWAGLYATIVIALSFGIVAVVDNTFNICDTHSLGNIGHTLLCNLDRNYGFEPKSWFGVWFIIAAYIYQAERWVKISCLRLFKHGSAIGDRDSNPGATSNSGAEGISHHGEG
jgi:hypothetical protein